MRSNGNGSVSGNRSVPLSSASLSNRLTAPTSSSPAPHFVSSASSSWSAACLSLGRGLASRVAVLLLVAFLLFQALFLYAMTTRHALFGESLQDIRDITSSHLITSSSPLSHARSSTHAHSLRYRREREREAPQEQEEEEEREKEHKKEREINREHNREHNREDNRQRGLGQGEQTEKEKEEEGEGEEEDDEELLHAHTEGEGEGRYRAHPVHLLSVREAEAVRASIPPDSLALLEALLGGPLPFVDFPDLRYRPAEEVRSSATRVFEALPAHLLEDYKNPCFLSQSDRDNISGNARVECLPYAYVLGQPKCGTSDLFERLRVHDEVVAPRRKEVRWFTRGEFSASRLARQDGQSDNSADNLSLEKERLIGRSTSLSSFTRYFSPLADAVQRDLVSKRESNTHTQSAVQRMISFDGGPHTLWWPTQQPNGDFSPEDVPAAQYIRELQPRAKFVLSLCNPVQRLYSDYHFLADDRRPVKRVVRKTNANAQPPTQPHSETEKSSRQLHDRVRIQIARFHDCVDAYMSVLLRQWQEQGRDVHIHTHTLNDSSASLQKLKQELRLPNKEHEEHLSLWFRASQMCAHDRHAFAVAGWGRLSIGLYALFLEKWLEHFSPQSFLALALEEFSLSPEKQLSSLHNFLSLSPPSEQSLHKALSSPHANAHSGERAPMWEKTRRLLNEFYRPYNALLAHMLQKDVFTYNENAENKANNGNSTQKDNTRSKSNASREKTEKQTSRHALDHSSFNIAQSEADRKDKLVPRKKTLLRGVAEPAPRETASRSRETEPEIAIDDLPKPESFQLQDPKHQELITLDLHTLDSKTKGRKLCEAAFRLNVASLAYLLHEKALDPGLLTDHGRTAWHCLANVFTFGDAHSKSYVFAALKGQSSWLGDLLRPPLDPQMESVVSRDIVRRLAHHSERAAEWLFHKGVPLSQPDEMGYTPLHLAVIGGEHRLVRYLLHHKADANAQNCDKRSPAHYAAALGHAQILGLLRNFGAELEARDRFGVRALDIASAPGAISHTDALRYLNVTQRAARQIQRELRPELRGDDTAGSETKIEENNATQPLPRPHSPQNLSYLGWPAGTGEWSLQRLPGTEQELDCGNIDQYYAHEITAEEVFHHYLARNAPVMIRGLLHPLAESVKTRFSKPALRQRNGNLAVTVSDIPYAAKFGGKDSQAMTLEDYIAQLEADKEINNNTNSSNDQAIRTGYVFRGHPIPSASERDDSLVPYKAFPTPWTLQAAFSFASAVTTASSRLKSKAEDTANLPVDLLSAVEPATRRSAEREIFVNAQWAFGGPGTGAPVHFHNTAWSALLYGAKKWYIYPPHNAIMSKKQILDFIQTDAEKLASRPVEDTPGIEVGTPADREADRDETLPYATCVQTAGDVIIIPESWGHGVLNLQESIAVATEFRQSLFRLMPGVSVLSSSPAFDNLKGRRRKPGG